ncbi:MAG: hypothetical protein R3Y59_08310, partial [bacterium]
MKRFFLILTLVCAVVGLQAADNIPYYHSFEDSQVAENANWVLNPANITLYNFWCVGDALSSDGSKSMYMSLDEGETHSIKGTQANTILAYRVFDIAEPGTYDLSFDWMALGEGTSALYVAWIDDETEYVVCNNSNSLISIIANNNLTTESGATAMQLSSVWQNEITQIEVKEGKKYKLVFAWYNPSTSLVKDPPGAIDNISITSRNCTRIANLEVDASGTTANVSWEGIADYEYGIKYKAYTDATWTQTTSTTTSATFYNLASGVYDFAVRSICNDGDTGVWVYFDKILIYNALCIDYIDLEASTVVCTTGTTGNPYASQGVVDYGYDSNSSRHTVHFVPGELDANAIDEITGYQLSTVPEGEVASVRIGNMASDAMAETVTYQYTVDSTVAPVLMLKYALVLEAPGHGVGIDPEFQIKFLNQFNQELGSCTSATFTGTTSNVGSNGWYKSNEGTNDIVWKDWTTVGINLAIYHGQTLKIRLINLDCTAGGHYSYGYFTLGCSEGKLEGVNCGDTPTDSFVAPDGFDYKWYLLSDASKTTLSTDRIFYVPEDDIQTYAVDMMFPENNSCYFTLTASAIPRFPRAVASVDYKAENCQYTAYLKNDSYIYTVDNDGYEGVSTETLEVTHWIYPDGTTETNTEIEYSMPSDGSTVSLQLVARMGSGSGMCSDTITVNLQAPVLQDTITEINWKICQGDYFNFAGEQLTESGEYRDSLKSDTGCDSIMILNLQVIDNIETYISDTICANESYLFGDTIITTAGTYVDSLSNYLGCDSTVTLDLEVIDVLSYLATDELIACADDGAIMIPISIAGGSADSLYVEFSEDALAQGFSNDSVTYENDILTIYPPADVKPNIYTFDLTLTDTLCGAMTSPITINIYYPS